jgi:hypothetical protein
MSDFTKVLQTVEYTQTWNGALSLSTPDSAGQSDGRISLFFKGIRKVNLPYLYEFLNKSSKENLVDTFCLVFNLRDCRAGKGERNLGRKALIWLFLNFPKEFSQIVHLLPEYGRWDDMLVLWPRILDISILKLPYLCENYCVKINGTEGIKYLKQIQLEIVRLMGRQLELDKFNMEKGNPVTLCAKWAPSQNDHNDRNYNVVKTLCSTMNWSQTKYRKVYLSPLRAYLKIVERYMCSKDWVSIDFSKVPSNAMKRLKEAFLKNTPDTFNQWKSELNIGNSSINAKQLYPHEIVSVYRKKNLYDPIYEEQWKVLQNQLNNTGVFKNTLCVVDVSVSMTGWLNERGKKVQTPTNFKPIDVCIGLGIIISNSIKGTFHNHIISFHSEPTFKILPEKCSLYDKLQLLQQLEWGGSTNLTKTFDMILDKAKRVNLSQEAMPEKIFIISDIQFNYCGKKTNFQYVDQKYKASGYNRPQLVFWNVNGSINDTPVCVDDNNTVLLSGFSLLVLKSIFKTTDFSPYNIMMETINEARYDPVREAFNTPPHSSGPISTPSSNKVYLQRGATV